jgi:type VI protein secretion system component VasK
MTEGEIHMLATYQYPILDLFWTMLMVFLFVIWIWLLIYIFMDIFRSHDMGGWVKALWVIFIVFLPFLGVLVYLIARGGSMQERSIKQAQQQKQEFDQYVRETAGSASPADQLQKLADLRASGSLSDADYEKAKAKILA